jgi:ABC-2 type transport system permease protein
VMTYSAKRTLPFLLEMRRQISRKRTLIIYLFMIGLPALIAAAVKYGGSNDRGGRGSQPDLVSLATHGAANFAATMVYFATGFVLVVVVATFAGDTVASEASWATMRYLLASPVPRATFLLKKLTAALTLAAGAILTLPIASYFIGWGLFGDASFISPLGNSYPVTKIVSKLLIVMCYLFLSLLFCAALAFLISTMTTVPLGAVGSAVGIVIVSNILDAISSLGTLRQWLPTHYLYSWLDLFTPGSDPTNMIRGASLSVILSIVCITIALIRFSRVDVSS